jgi:hypothetical protein
MFGSSGEMTLALDQVQAVSVCVLVVLHFVFVTAPVFYISLVGLTTLVF